MTVRARFALVLALVLVVAIGLVLGLRWLSRSETLALTAPDVPGTVILIPGYGGGSGGFEGLASYLRGQGRAVVVADIGDGQGDIAGYGSQVAALASSLVARGDASVDLVGYSMGGLVARAAARGNPAAIRRVATVASPHAGTQIAALGAFLGDTANCPAACRQMAPDSEFLQSLPVAEESSRWLSAWTEGDDVVRPPESGALEGSSQVDVTADCAAGSLDHGGIIRAPVVWTLVSDFLATGSVAPSCS